MRRIISLYDLGETALIILDPNGVTYTNQTGGNFCMQPEETGFLSPFGDGEVLVPQLERITLNACYLTDEQATAVDRILASYPETRSGRVDRSRLQESNEAWIYLLVSPDEASAISGFGDVQGVVTWPNSD